MKLSVMITALLLMLPLAQAHDDPIEQITVSGVGKVEAEPDQVVLAISVYAIQKELEAAKNEADSRYKSVLEQAKGADIDKKDIRVSRLNMYPEYEWASNERILKGQRVSRSIEITVKDLSVLPTLLQSLVESGISTVDSMTAGFQDKSLYQEKALAQAALDARAKAMFLAEQLDRQLGSAFHIVEQNAHASMYPKMEMASRSMASGGAAPPQEQLGTQTITANISVSFKLN